MKANPGPQAQTKVLDGNRAAAYGVMLCQPDVFCAYPITPQSEIVEQLYLFQAQGLLNAATVEVESEHSAMGVLRGAAASGARTFTATSSQGLAFMFENCINVATTRLPIVMVNVCRQMIAPHVVTSSNEDAMMTKETGWIQIHTETCQEILDSVIMAYKLAEDPEIRIPVMVCHDGYYLSHLWEPTQIPTLESVREFLPPLKMSPKIDPRTPLTMGPNISGEMGSHLRYRHSKATQLAKERFDRIDQEFKRALGRSYGGQIEEYRTEDAEIVMLALGSGVGTLRVAVDQKREEGVKVGLVKIRMFRPFPHEKLAVALKDKKAVGVLDKNVSFGWGRGHLSVESRAALFSLPRPIPMASFISGLTSMDTTVEKLCSAIETTQLAADAKPYQEVTWLNLE